MPDNCRVELQLIRTPVLIGKSGARVFRVRREDGAEWIRFSYATPVEKTLGGAKRLVEGLSALV